MTVLPAEVFSESPAESAPLPLGALREFGYLTAPKAGIYRALMRLMYEAHLSQRHTLPPEEILIGLREQGLGERYDLPDDAEALLLELEQLVEWGNLGRRRDARRVSTLAEYARRRDLYYATARGLAIEGFLEAGLDAAADTVAVGAGIVRQMEARLDALELLLSAEQPDGEEIETLWKELHGNFVNLSGDVRTLALNLERKLSLEALDDFLDFKDAVRSYVERLAGELAGPGRRLRSRLLAMRPERLLQTVAQVRSGRLTVSAGVLDQTRAGKAAQREWSALQSWFARSAEQGDGLEYAITALRGAVTRVLAYVDAVHRTRELGLGRAAELKALAEQLSGLPDVGLARQMLSSELGLFAALHAIGEAAPARVASVWQTPTERVRLSPVTRGKRAEISSAEVGQVSASARKAAREAMQTERQRQRALSALFENAPGGVLTLHELRLGGDELLPDVLGWLNAAAEAEEGEGLASGPGGAQVQVRLLPGQARLRGPAWTLWIEQNAEMELVGQPSGESA